MTSLAGALKDAAAALRGDSVDVIKLGHAYVVLQSAKIQDAALTALLPDVGQELEQAQYALGDTFGQALRAALAEQGIAIGGRPPRFEVGRFEIAANFVSRGASISYGKDVVVKRAPLSVEAVLKAYPREAKAIMGRNEDGARWVEQFYQAWENARRAARHKRQAREYRRLLLRAGAAAPAQELPQRAQQKQLRGLQPRPIRLRLLRVRECPAPISTRA